MDGSIGHGEQGIATTIEMNNNMDSGDQSVTILKWNRIEIIPFSTDITYCTRATPSSFRSCHFLFLAKDYCCITVAEKQSNSFYAMAVASGEPVAVAAKLLDTYLERDQKFPELADLVIGRFWPMQCARQTTV